MRIVVLASWVVLSLIVPALARADAVGPPPDTCPPGSSPSTAHSGPYCAPLTDCAADSACGTGAACSEVRQCVETRECGGMTFPDAERCTLDHVVGPCAGAGSCAVGTCRTRRVCSTPTTGGSSSGGCGCRVAPSGGEAPTFVALAAAGLVLARIRRRRVSWRSSRASIRSIEA